MIFLCGRMGAVVIDGLIVIIVPGSLFYVRLCAFKEEAGILSVTMIEISKGPFQKKKSDRCAKTGEEE